MNDTASVLHSPGLLEFAAAAGLCRSESCRPFNWFNAFMTNNEGDQVASWAWIRLEGPMHSPAHMLGCMPHNRAGQGQSTGLSRLAATCNLQA